MKTLDEVIATMDGIDQTCTCCSYQHECDEVECVEKTALYYLKMFRSDSRIYAENQKYWETELKQKIKDFGDAKDRYIAKLKELEIGTLNKPLTWDELKTMKGKPVWIEHRSGKKGWCLIVQVDDSLPDIPCIGLVDTNAEYCNLEIEWMSMGQWQAYRKERYEPDQKAH